MQHTLVLEFNNIEQLEAAFVEQGQEISCLMKKPICGNMNFVRSSVPFVKRCRELCTRYGALQVFDKVMTGFRVALTLPLRWQRRMRCLKHSQNESCLRFYKRNSLKAQ